MSWSFWKLDLETTFWKFLALKKFNLKKDKRFFLWFKKPKNPKEPKNKQNNFCTSAPRSLGVAFYE
jgi:hypothetical protein